MIDESEWGPSVLAWTRPRLRALAEEAGLLDDEVSVLARPLTSEEAIGQPGRRDFPIIIGKERMLEATFRGAKGHAFTDAARDFARTLAGVLEPELSSNQRRAIYVATLNAVLRHLGRASATVHCKDDDPERCGVEIARRLRAEHGDVTVGLVGLNPAIAEHLVDEFGPAHVRITDLFRDNIGQKRFGVEVWDGVRRTEELVRDSDVVLVTGTTLQNDSFDAIWRSCRATGTACVVFGVTGAGVCALTGIPRLCPCGR